MGGSVGGLCPNGLSLRHGKEIPVFQAAPGNTSPRSSREALA